MMSEIWKISDSADITPFHQLLAALHCENRLLRVYTQNIDGLEKKSGLSYGVSSLEDDISSRPVCVPLHGDLLVVECDHCRDRHSMKLYYAVFRTGKLPLCPRCQADNAFRAEKKLRSRPIGQLRPNVVLYDQSHPQSIEIGICINDDIKQAPDLLLVSGTSMKIPSLAKAVKDLSRVSSNSIFINQDFPSSAKGWSDVFQFWISGNLQIFSRNLMLLMGDDKQNNDGVLKGSLHGSLDLDNVEKRYSALSGMLFFIS